jgi:hypothetical protein
MNEGDAKYNRYAGEIEFFLRDSVNTVQVLRDAGVSAQLVILEGQPHI